MPFIKPRTNRVRRVRQTCSLPESNRDVLVQYARFLGDSTDYVFNTLLEGHPGQGSRLHRVAHPAG